MWFTPGLAFSYRPLNSSGAASDESLDAQLKASTIRDEVARPSRIQIALNLIIILQAFVNVILIGCGLYLWLNRGPNSLLFPRALYCTSANILSFSSDLMINAPQKCMQLPRRTYFDMSSGRSTTLFSMNRSSRARPPRRSIQHGKICIVVCASSLYSSQIRLDLNSLFSRRVSYLED